MLNKIKKQLGLGHKRVKLFLFYLPKLTFKKTATTKTIIVCFDGVFAHGGFVDRLKGIISFYEVSKQLGYSFKIHFSHPFQLDYFFKPNEINWIQKKVKYNPFDTKIIYLMDNFSVNPMEKIKNSKANTFLVYANVDYFGKLYPNHSAAENKILWKNNFNELFHYSDNLKQEVSKLPQEKRIVFHTRFTTLMGDFKDTTSKVLSAVEKQELIVLLLHKINKVMEENREFKPYVLSDSLFFLNYIRANTSYNVLEGEPKHVDVKDNNASMDSHYKTITDFIFIAESESVYLLKEGAMYPSSFSKYAAIVGNKPFEVIQ